LDDLRQLDEVERVDVELFERRLARDLLDVGAEARERLDDARLDGVWSCDCHGGWAPWGGWGWWAGLRVQAAMPPSTDSTDPVTYEAASEARKRTHAATSSGVPARLAGIAASRSPFRSAVMSVSIRPGATALTVTPRRATSAATVFVIAIRPAFEAA